jgi:hypothetical protein
MKLVTLPFTMEFVRDQNQLALALETLVDQTLLRVRGLGASDAEMIPTVAFFQNGITAEVGLIDSKTQPTRELLVGQKVVAVNDRDSLIELENGICLFYNKLFVSLDPHMISVIKP